jgi:hypothetical protein
MKKKCCMQNWLPAALKGVALAGATSLALAGDITYNFNTDAQGWYAADSHGSVVWDETHGRGGGGCLKCTIVAGTDTEIDPRVDVNYDTTGYFSVEFDMIVDPSSGTDGAGIYGNLQTVDWNAAWTWHAQWYGSLGGAGGPFSNWKHVIVPFSAAYGPRVRLAFQIAAGTAPYSSDVIIYIDNIIIRDGTPPNKAVLYSFAWPETCVPDSTWGGGTHVPKPPTPTWSRDTTLLPTGCAKEVVDYGAPGANLDWVDAPGEFHTPTFDPTKFTYIDFDLYLDAPTGLPSYGDYELAYWWSWISLGTAGLSSANIGKWTHYSFALPPPGANTPQGIVFHPGGNNMSGIFTYYIANVTLWKPANPPTLTHLDKASGVKGVQVTMIGNGQWDREALVTPSDRFGGGSCFWTDEATTGAPTTYSFTISDFPDATKHGGFEAYMFIINGDTDGGTGNQVNGGADWNAADLVRVHLTAVAAGGYDFSIDWKTNRPGANPLGDAIYHPATVHSTTALGTWSLVFTSNTEGALQGPGGLSAPFTLPAGLFDSGVANFRPSVSYIHYGMFKNDGANDGHNNGAHGTFAEVQRTGMYLTYDDTFPGPTLTTTYAWRTTNPSSVIWTPAGLAWWLTWTVPDDGYSVKVAPHVTGPYTDAGVTLIYPLGATRVGGIPSTSIPSGDSAFFLLAKPVR